MDKRKRDKNTDPADIEGYLGPWAKYVDEETVSKPTDDDAAYLEEYLAKRQKKGRREEEVPMEEQSTLHIKDDKDYQGRSFLHVPQDLGINLKSGKYSIIQEEAWLRLLLSPPPTFLYVSLH